jgi:calcium homeostasis endoplasmic reticulum protein
MDPVAHADVRDRSDMFKGIGIPINDPFENFRKNRSQGYVSRMREKAESVAASIPVQEEEPI